MSDYKIQFSLAMSCGYEEFGKLQPNGLKFIKLCMSWAHHPPWAVSHMQPIKTPDKLQKAWTSNNHPLQILLRLKSNEYFDILRITTTFSSCLAMAYTVEAVEAASRICPGAS